MNGEFVVTEEWLVEVFSQAVSMNVADWLGVAEAMIYDWMHNACKTD